ncbi:hypothetical protein ACFC1L_40070 [Streptomyces sp. NPDC056210]|uniref:hypothetical protein n=1 Tax=Streptomyces sp. NPDC056210 TaxID=3345746 RepID=UPI0035DE1AF1
MRESYLLPDSEAIALEALRLYVPDLAGTPIQYVVKMPDEWYHLMPVVMVRRTAGTAENSSYLDQAVFTVHCFASTRRDASLLSRSIRKGLLDASRVPFVSKTEGGSMFHFREIGGPFYSAGNDNVHHPDVFRFVASYQLMFRPVV